MVQWCPTTRLDARMRGRRSVPMPAKAYAGLCRPRQHVCAAPAAPLPPRPTTLSSPLPQGAPPCLVLSATPPPASTMPPPNPVPCAPAGQWVRLATASGRRTAAWLAPITPWPPALPAPWGGRRRCGPDGATPTTAPAEGATRRAAIMAGAPCPQLLQQAAAAACWMLPAGACAGGRGWRGFSAQVARGGAAYLPAVPSCWGLSRGLSSWVGGLCGLGGNTRPRA